MPNRSDARRAFRYAAARVLENAADHLRKGEIACAEFLAREVQGGLTEVFGENLNPTHRDEQ